MILIGFCYAEGRLMDFRIDEHLPLRNIYPLMKELLLEETAEILTAEEKTGIGHAAGLRCGNRKLDMERSAEENGIRYGDILFPVYGIAGGLP